MLVKKRKHHRIGKRHLTTYSVYRRLKLESKVAGVKDNISAFHSSEYDRKIRQTIPFYDEFYRQVTNVVRVLDKKISWLDVGCGLGKMAEAAIGEIDLSKFTFYDISPTMIEAVKKKFLLPFTDFMVGSVQELKYHNDFDVVTSIQVNHYLHHDERENVIKNYYQALRNEGIFITFENFAPSSEAGKDLYLKRWKNFQIENGKDHVESEKHVERYGVNYFPISISEHIELMKHCGFRAVEILWVSYMQVGLLGIK